MNILIIGSGGREHALAWKVAQSPIAEQIFVAPGNAGTELEDSVSNIDIQADDIESLAIIYRQLPMAYSPISTKPANTLNSAPYR